MKVVPMVQNSLDEQKTKINIFLCMKWLSKFSGMSFAHDLYSPRPLKFLSLLPFVVGSRRISRLGRQVRKSRDCVRVLLTRAGTGQRADAKLKKQKCKHWVYLSISFFNNSIFFYSQKYTW